jgi:hypothetical protein
MPVGGILTNLYFYVSIKPEIPLPRMFEHYRMSDNETR